MLKVHKSVPKAEYFTCHCAELFSSSLKMCQPFQLPLVFVLKYDEGKKQHVNITQVTWNTLF